MKKVKSLVLLGCFVLLPAILHAEDDCDSLWTRAAIAANCRALKRIEANQQKIIKALELLIQQKRPDFKIETMGTKGER
jgi:hypothetical protein